MPVMVLGASALQARLRAVAGTTKTDVLMRKVGTAAVFEAKMLERPHRKTGVTDASIKLGTVTPTSAVVRAGGAAPYLEFGTRPHLITPKVAKVLAWGGPRRLSGALRKGAKATNFAMYVHHPGTKPSPFMVPGAKLAIARANLAGIIVAAWDSVP